MSKPSPSYLALHELRGCGASPSSWLVIRRYRDGDTQDEIFSGSFNDAKAYLAAHWDDQP